FATHDTVHEYLSTRASRMGITLINGAAQSAAIARRKSMTYRHFADRDWVPRVYASVDDVDAWPAIVKPDLGPGGQGVTRVDDAREATEAMQRVEQPLLVEYLPGDEVTVDCFTDRSRRLLWIGPRTRERVKAGISMRSRLLPQSPRITEIAHQIN
ncbi:ATP-grasp domain-containing protein, partial [Bacillus subtilis]|uniref:ATP-grasp domain-containing protein n=1 Tax=Bacillus subtilis TaxID=1423 RepID=UPI00203CF88F